MSVFLGIDIGTTAIKLGVIHKNELLYTQQFSVKTYGDNVIKYQNGKEILALLEHGILEIPTSLRRKITKISFSTAMHSLMPYNGQQQIFLWSDIQASGVIDSFKQTDLATYFYQLTGTPIHAMSTFAKIMYFQATKKYPVGTKWYGIKELVMQYFTGKAIIDYSTASATGLFDLHKMQWSTEILEFLDISVEQLADLADTNQTFEPLPKIQSLLGFNKNVKVVIGASDGTLAAYASFYHTGRTASLTIGTSAAVRQITKEIKLDQEKQNFCYYLNNKYKVSGAPSNNGGCVLAWASEQLATNSTDFFEELPNLLEKTSIGAKGLKFWPFLNGERAPYWTNNIKGGFQGLTIKHNREDMIRSVIEGILLNIKQLVELISGDEPLSVSGGFFQTTELGQLAADIFGVCCYYAPQNEPIFGLYYLLEQPELGQEEAQQLFKPNLSRQEKYYKISRDFFR